MAWTEYEDTTGQDWHLFAGFGIAPDTLAFLANKKAAERGNFHHFIAHQRVGYFAKHGLHKICGFVSRQANFLIDRFGQLRACNGIPGHRFPL
tara:strand:- start:414 stop:692 length:279 start_codon:yes stop_codon:yes gene_type:complete